MSTPSKSNKQRGNSFDARTSKELTDAFVGDRYDCAVCADRIGKRAKIWSCSVCYTSLHLVCAQKWARSHALGPATKSKPSMAFKCMTCETECPFPSEYRCFCGKQPEPQFDAKRIPHSCAGTCGRPRSIDSPCTHKCPNLCHPGPCSPCPNLATKACPCGGMKYRLPCGTEETLRKTCERVCDRLLDCGEHRCALNCHNGDCMECVETEHRAHKVATYGHNEESAVDCAEEQMEGWSAEAEEEPFEGAEDEELGEKWHLEEPQLDHEEEDKKEGPYIPIPALILEMVSNSGLQSLIPKIESAFTDSNIQSGNHGRGSYVKNGNAVHFPPFASDRRWLIHQIASYYRYESESLDHGPKRSVRALKTEFSLKPPMSFGAAYDLYRKNRHSANTPSDAKQIHFLQLDKGVTLRDIRKLIQPWRAISAVYHVDQSHAIALILEEGVDVESIKANICSRSPFKKHSLPHTPSQMALYFMESPNTPEEVLRACRIPRISDNDDDSSARYRAFVNQQLKEERQPEYVRKGDAKPKVNARQPQQQKPRIRVQTAESQVAVSANKFGTFDPEQESPSPCWSDEFDPEQFS